MLPQHTTRQRNKKIYVRGERKKINTLIREVFIALATRNPVTLTGSAGNRPPTTIFFVFRVQQTGRCLPGDFAPDYASSGSIP